MTAGGRVRRHVTGYGERAQSSAERECPAEKMVAGQALDMEILKEAAKGNW